MMQGRSRRGRGGRGALACHGGSLSLPFQWRWNSIALILAEIMILGTSNEVPHMSRAVNIASPVVGSGTTWAPLMYSRPDEHEGSGGRDEA